MNTCLQFSSKQQTCHLVLAGTGTLHHFSDKSNINPQNCQLASPVRALCGHLMMGQWIVERTTSIMGMWSITLQSSPLWDQVDHHGPELADNTGSEGLGLWSTDSYYAIPGMAWLWFWVGSYEDHVKDLIDSTYSSSAILLPDPCTSPFPDSFCFEFHVCKPQGCSLCMDSDPLHDPGYI